MTPLLLFFLLLLQVTIISWGRGSRMEKRASRHQSFGSLCTKMWVNPRRRKCEAEGYFALKFSRGQTRGVFILPQWRPRPRPRTWRPSSASAVLAIGRFAPFPYNDRATAAANLKFGPVPFSLSLSRRTWDGFKKWRKDTSYKDYVHERLELQINCSVLIDRMYIKTHKIAVNGG